MFNNYKKSKKLPKYQLGDKTPMTNDQYNMSLYSQSDQDALNGVDTGGSTQNIYNEKRGSSFGANQS